MMGVQERVRRVQREREEGKGEEGERRGGKEVKVSSLEMNAV